MTQKMRLLLATFLTAFVLVLAGGVFGGVSTHWASQAAPAVAAANPSASPLRQADDQATGQAEPSAVAPVSAQPAVVPSSREDGQATGQAEPPTVAPSVQGDRKANDRERTDLPTDKRHGDHQDEDEDDE